MEERFLTIAKVFRPELETMSVERRLAGIGDVLSVLYSAPIAFAGLIWLALTTDLKVVQENAILLVLFAVLWVIFNRAVFFFVVELGPNRYASADGSLFGIVLWSAMLLIGPIFLWFIVLWSIYGFVIDLRTATSNASRWDSLRNFSLQIAAYTTGLLLPLTFYRRLGGQYPFAGFTSSAIFPALGAMLLFLLLMIVLWSGYLAYVSWSQGMTGEGSSVRTTIYFFFLALGLNFAPHPFAILASGLFIQNGPLIFIFFMVGMFMVAYLARRLSKATESTRQQSRQLERLEQLGRAIINAPPGEETLPDILQEHLPNMFPAGNLVVWTFPDRILFKHPEQWTPDLDTVWPWLLRQTEVQGFLPKDATPWNDQYFKHQPVLMAPIQEFESGQTFGGFYLELHTLAQPWDRRSLNTLIPAVQSFTDQITSAMHQSVVYSRSLEYQRVTQELQMAGDIQSSLLPTILPNIPGWQFAMTLEPAGETSGDFFDIIPLTDGKIGIVVADVMDKGVGPALYMAISRTLIRTYAIELDSQPDTVFFATNERILTDTTSSLFVTAFYGVLNPKTGELTYCNAGHNPPYLLRSDGIADTHALIRNAIPIGIAEDTTWGNDTVLLQPGDALILYTDGIPDAQNHGGEFFGESSLVEVAKASLGKSAGDLQAAILDAVHQFVGGAPQYDDITLMVLVRDR
ncbi:MAG TPA: PP2C family protein-serine/threonine phosphatase [Anaerolineae bacterium]|nr:PP2C family protein-serine/threonine phosphatase [Anaerolineae bacterium]